MNNCTCVGLVKVPPYCTCVGLVKVPPYCTCVGLIKVPPYCTCVGLVMIPPVGHRYYKILRPFQINLLFLGPDRLTILIES